MKIELASLGTVLAALNESPGTVSAAVIFGGEYYDGKKNVFFNQLFALDPAAKVLYIQRERERERERKRERERERERDRGRERERESEREREARNRMGAAGEGVTLPGVIWSPHMRQPKLDFYAVWYKSGKLWCAIMLCGTNLCKRPGSIWSSRMRRLQADFFAVWYKFSDL